MSASGRWPGALSTAIAVIGVANDAKLVFQADSMQVDAGVGSNQETTEAVVDSGGSVKDTITG